jgi:hypothetical protein
MARHMSPLIAFRRAGLSNTMQPIGPSRSTRSLPLIADPYSKMLK